MTVTPLSQVQFGSHNTNAIGTLYHVSSHYRLSVYLLSCNEGIAVAVGVDCVMAVAIADTTLGCTLVRMHNSVGVDVTGWIISHSIGRLLVAGVVISLCIGRLLVVGVVVSDCVGRLLVVGVVVSDCVGRLLVVGVVMAFKLVVFTDSILFF